LSILRYIFIAASVAVVFIFVVHLRRQGSGSFYQFRSAYSQHNRLKQQLWQAQLQLESLVNPASVSQRFEEPE